MHLSLEEYLKLQSDRDALIQRITLLESTPASHTLAAMAKGVSEKQYGLTYDQKQSVRNAIEQWKPAEDAK